VSAGAARPPLRDDLTALEGYHSPQVDVDVRLNTNESPYPPPPGFHDALAAEISRVQWHRYPDRAAVELREAIAAQHGVDPANVFAANGSNEVLQSVCLAYGGFGRTAALFQPTYLMHGQIARTVGTAVVEGGRAPDLTLDLDEVRRVVDRHQPSILFVTSPNNPTGIVESPEAIRAAADAAPGIVVVDEAYAQFAPWSALELVDEERPLVVTRTFSKTWSMAAARLGYLVGPSWLVEALDLVVLPYHLDSLKQIAGRVALRFTDEMDERVQAIVDERERLVAALDDLPVDQWPSGANFVLFRPRAADGRRVWQGLLDRSVLVRDTSSWPGLEGCLRVTVGTPEEDDRFLAALADVLREEDPS
jgi:histidinol-phosphate aminotransferase